MSSGIAPVEQDIATILPTRNNGSDSTVAIRKNNAAPISDIRPAATAAGSFRVCTSDTTTGVSNRPMLAAVETSALAIGPGSPKHLTTVRRRNVVPAVSRMPLQTARRCSNLKVTLVRSARSIRGGHYPENRPVGDS